jgi:fucose permease
MALFFVNSTATAHWMARIPALKERLGLGEGALGAVLLGNSAGALVALAAAGWLLSRYESRWVTVGAALLQCASLVAPALAPDAVWLALALVGVGAFSSVTDVAMNVQAVGVEKRAGRPLMSSFLGGWRRGGGLGAAAGGALASLGWTPLPHFALVAVPLAVLTVVAARWLPSGEAEERGSSFAVPPRALLGLGLVLVLAGLSEGAAGNWGGVYLREALGSSEGLAAMAFSLFLVGMTAGRVVGDALERRLGAVVLLRLSGLASAAGFALALLAREPAGALAGLTLAGLGGAWVFPLVYGAAGRIQGVPPGVGLAAVATMGYVGFLAGPPAIGGLAEVVTLQGALGLVALACLFIIPLAGAVAGRSAGPP